LHAGLFEAIFTAVHAGLLTALQTHARTSARPRDLKTKHQPQHTCRTQKTSAVSLHQRFLAWQPDAAPAALAYLIVEPKLHDILDPCAGLHIDGPFRHPKTVQHYREGLHSTTQTAACPPGGAPHRQLPAHLVGHQLVLQVRMLVGELLQDCTLLLMCCPLSLLVGKLAFWRASFLVFGPAADASVQGCWWAMSAGQVLC